MLKRPVRTYAEALLKEAASFWVVNFYFGAWGVLFAFISMYWQDWAAIHSRAIFNGFDALVWLLIIAQACGGLVISVCLKFHSNTSKNFAQSFASLVICAVSHHSFGEKMGPLFLFGGAVIFFANALYRDMIFPLRASAGYL